jgi:DNA-binding beta-propeller fold protein YncE
MEEQLHARLQNQVTKENNWVIVQASVQKHVMMANQKVKLDIGGHIFSTTRSLLLSFKDSFFAAMLGSGYWKPSTDGTYFVDRTPTYFQTMLDFMRNGKLDERVVLWNASKIDKLQQEFDFYQVDFPAAIKPGCQGLFEKMWGCSGVMEGEFYSPRMASVSDENEVYILDALNFRIQVFDLHGRFQRKWNLHGKVPAGITTGWGRVYLLAPEGDCINVFTATGVFLKTFGEYGTGEGQLRFPSGVTCDPVRNVIYITDTINNRVVVFNPDHVYISTIPLALWMDLPRNVLIVKDKVLIVDDNGSVCVFNIQWDEGITELKSSIEFKWHTVSKVPCTFTCSVDGEIYVCEKGSNKIFVCSVEGNVLRHFALPGPLDFKIWSAAFSIQGYMFIVDKLGNRVMQLQ